jgi:hypothetical protein
LLPRVCGIQHNSNSFIAKCRAICAITELSQAWHGNKVSCMK